MRISECQSRIFLQWAGKDAHRYGVDERVGTVDDCNVGVVFAAYFPQIAAVAEADILRRDVQRRGHAPYYCAVDGVGAGGSAASVADDNITIVGETFWRGIWPQSLCRPRRGNNILICEV